jgi:hypothetical protein
MNHAEFLKYQKLGEQQQEAGHFGVAGVTSGLSFVSQLSILMLPIPPAFQVRKDATCTKEPTDAEFLEPLRLLSERRFGRPCGSRKFKCSGQLCTVATLM